MPGDSVHAVEGLARRVRALGDRSVKLTTLRDQIATDLDRTREEATGLGKRIELLTLVAELFRQVMDLLVVKQVRAVEEVVTEGLQTIFFDQSLSFEADVSTKWNKIAVQFFIRRRDKSDPLSHRGPPLEAFGGGPSSVASLALRILTVMRLKLWPLLVLDESLGAVSDEYVDQTGQFLRSLAGKMGFDVLLVTHKAPFLEHADVSYRCTEVVEDDGSTHLALRGI